MRRRVDDDTRDIGDASKTPAQQGCRAFSENVKVAPLVRSRPGREELAAGLGQQHHEHDERRGRQEVRRARARAAVEEDRGRRGGRRGPAARARPRRSADGSPERPVWLSVRPPCGVGGNGLPSSTATTTSALDEFHGDAESERQQGEPVVIGRTEQGLGVDGGVLRPSAVPVPPVAVSPASELLAAVADDGSARWPSVSTVSTR